MKKIMDGYRVRRIMAVLALIGSVMAVYLLVARPYQLQWGATEEEVKRPMPGDELDPDPAFLATRAITINGAAKDIWPWLLQMGYGRAGFYGYDILENLGSERGILSAEHILPEFQHFAVGDEVPISSVARMVFHAVEPDQYSIWTGTNGIGGYGLAHHVVCASTDLDGSLIRAFGSLGFARCIPPSFRSKSRQSRLYAVAWLMTFSKSSFRARK